MLSSANLLPFRTFPTAQQAEFVCDVRSILGENPLWDSATGSLFSIDCMGRRQLRHDLASGQSQEWALVRTPGAVALRALGGLLLANRQGLAFFDPATPKLKDVGAPWIDFAREVINDGKCDSQGRFWVGTTWRR